MPPPKDPEKRAEWLVKVQTNLIKARETSLKSRTGKRRSRSAEEDIARRKELAKLERKTEQLRQRLLRGAVGLLGVDESEGENPDTIEMSKQGYFTILLDENLGAEAKSAEAKRDLSRALEDAGFKVVVPDEVLKHQARGWAILTCNSKDFVDDAVRYDYDVISIEGIKFLDTNETVKKISEAVRRSKIGVTRGNFCLQIHDDGSFGLEQLV